VTPLGLGWPNIISLFRVTLIPALVLLVIADDRLSSYLAAAVFVFGALTDGLDGYLARRYSTTTATGQWLDPLSDKLFVSAPVVTLTALGRFPVWAAVIIVAREVAVSILRAYLGTRGTAMPASEWGKVKTATQLVAITMYLLPLGAEAGDARLAALILAVVLTVYSGLDYALHASRGAGDGGGG
jgi:CDP-diacylglycerol--glycerol-3-phosphate 3-phosphatidyltransferase